jgi:hypothetical protein
MRDVILVFRCEGERFARGRIEKHVVMERGSWEKEVVINSVGRDHMFRGGTVSDAGRTEQTFEREYASMFSAVVS